MAEPWPSDVAEALTGRQDLDAFTRLEYYADVASTNDIALARANAGAPEGLSVLADLQRAGRGRRGRSWFSPPGAGLYLSIVTQPPRERLPVVTLVAGLAGARAVTAVTGLPVRLKWPNDLVVGTRWQKLGGVLCEGAASGAVVMGIGINLRPAAYPPDVADRATSIEGELGRPAERGALVVALLAAVRAGVSRLRDEPGHAWVRDAWRELAAPGSLGARVRWTDAAGDRRGLARDIDVDGALLVDADGRRERIIAGEVTWERRP